MCGLSKLENVNIKLRGFFKHKSKSPLEYLKQYYHRFIYMFPGLGNAKILTLDLDTVEALIAVSDFLARFPSPFYNLKFLKLPKGYQQSSLSDALKGYLTLRPEKMTEIHKAFGTMDYGPSLHCIGGDLLPSS
ncbi:hypothetical protein ACET3Z_001834 [Daucus carota]